MDTFSLFVLLDSHKWFYFIEPTEITIYYILLVCFQMRICVDTYSIYKGALILKGFI